VKGALMSNSRHLLQIAYQEGECLEQFLIDERQLDHLVFKLPYALGI
jgi:hypothetical protein